MKRLTLALGLLALAAVLAACSGSAAGSRRAPRRSAGTPSGDVVARRQGPQVLADRAVSARRARRSRSSSTTRRAHRTTSRSTDAAGAVGLQGRDRRPAEGHVRRPGARRRHLRLPLRGPSGHEGHDHRPVTSPRRTRTAKPRPAGASCSSGMASSLRTSDDLTDVRSPVTRSGVRPCSRSSTSRSDTAPWSRSTARTSPPAPGRIVGFLGPNGAGKTTTMRCIFGLARPDRGEVRWNGHRRSIATRGCGSATCPSSAACIRGCGSPSSSATSPSSTG